MIDPRWRDARRVLLVRLDNLGDVLVTTPAFHAVREALPGAHLTLLAGPVGAQVGRLNPDLDAVIVYEAPWMDPWHTLPQESARELAMVETLRAGRYDAAIIFTSYHQSPLPAAYLCYLADIPLRAAASIDGPGSLLTTRHKHPERMMHEVERGLDLVGALGMTTEARDLVLRVPEGARERMRAKLEALAGESDRVGNEANPRAEGRRMSPCRSAVGDEARLRGLEADPRRRRFVGAHGVRPPRGLETETRADDGPLVVVHPGCSMPARTYPWERFAQVIELLVAELGARVALTGAADETELIERLSGRLSTRARRATLPLAGALAFDELCALIEAADLTITNNTGPMHIAAALKTPVVALFALTNPPEQWGPWQVPHRQLYHEVACRLCYARVCPYGHECLTLVTPRDVLAAARDLLAEAAAAREGTESSQIHRDDARGADAEDAEGACHAPLRNDAAADQPPARVGGHGGLRPLGADSSAGLPRAAHVSGPREAAGTRGRRAMNDWLAARNILAVRMDNMGDVVLLGPALRAVKQTLPGARITLLASPAGAQIAPLLPWVDDLIVWCAIWQDVGNRMPLDPAREQELVRLLAERRFDAALIFTSFSQNPHLSGYACYLAGIPLRAGESKEFGGSALTTELRGCPDEMHQAERNLRLVEHLGFEVRDRQLAIRIDEQARARVPALLREAGMAPDEPYVLLHPGASCPARRYPADRYAEVARLLEARGYHVLVTGVEREAEIVMTAARAIPAERMLLGRTSVAELAALIERAALVICNDTLTLHLADAVRTPLVVLYSGTEYDEQWRPRAVRHRLLRRPTDCQPCYRFTCPIGLPCLDIPPAEVVAAVEEILTLGKDTENAEFAEARGGRGEGEGEQRFTTEATEGTEDRAEDAARATAEDAARQVMSPARAGGLRGRRPLGAGSPAGLLRDAGRGPRGGTPSGSLTSGHNRRGGGAQ